MQEKQKTIAYVVVAALAVVVAWEPWRGASLVGEPPVKAGAKLFAEFTDPLAAKSLEVVKFDEDTATLQPFKVAQVNGVWSIPSHSDYPADASDHMAQAATLLMDLKILNLQSSSPGDQELYGVITPDPQRVKQGTTGVGTRVTLKDGKDKVLADLVIGKEVKDSRDQRYVREADRDQIYKVAVNPEKLSTKFGDWIEKDLLKLNAFDVREVELNDYSSTESLTREGVQLLVRPRNRIKLAFDDTKSSWSIVEMSEFGKEGKPVPSKLADDEDLNSEKLNGMKTALDDLQIVDVQRKPKGLSQDLRASDELVKDNEAGMSLIERGFFPLGENREIYSSEGEATCTTKDGVRYVLRFGRLAGGDEAKGDEKTDAEGKEKSNPALNRYLFVMAQFDESQIPKPALEPVAGEEKASDEKADEEKPGDAKSDDAKPEESKAEPDEKKPVPETKTANDESKPAEDEKKAAEPAPKPDAPKAEAGKDEGKPKDAASQTQEEAKRIAVEKENKRKQDEYDSAVKKGQDRVAELNGRFADWYFIISDDTYKKIHLGRKDVVKKKESAEDKAAGPDALKNLQQGLPGLPQLPKAEQ